MKQEQQHTESTQRFKPVSYSNSWPSSVSRMNLLSTFENEMRGSLSNSAGSVGKLRIAGSGAGGAVCG